MRAEGNIDLSKRDRHVLGGRIVPRRGILLTHPDPAFAGPPEGRRGECTITNTTDMPAKMRDSTVLKADVYRPQTKEKVPVILA